MANRISKEEEIWNSSEWANRRSRELAWYNWYSAKKLRDAVSLTETDPDTGNPVKLYPLELNPIGKMCRIHRSVTVGIVDDYNEMPVQVVFQLQSSPDRGYLSNFHWIYLHVEIPQLQSSLDRGYLSTNSRQ